MLHKDSQGSVHCEALSTGDSNFIFPYVPHSFTKRAGEEGDLLPAEKCIVPCSHKARRVPPCAVKTCAVCPVFARMVGELRAADPSNDQGPVKQNASPGETI